MHTFETAGRVLVRVGIQGGQVDLETWDAARTEVEAAYEESCGYIESVGGTLHGFWYAFGEYDGYNLWEAPDRSSMAAVAIALSAGGALSKCETTELLTVEETLQALERVGTVGYRAPGA